MFIGMFQEEFSGLVSDSRVPSAGSLGWPPVPCPVCVHMHEILTLSGAGVDSTPWRPQLPLESGPRDQREGR